MSGNGGGVPHFLRALGLGLDAGERAVRRAYAQQLKRIDQEADPKGFQALRENYEAALRWSQSQEAAQGEEERAADADQQVPAWAADAATGAAQPQDAPAPPPAHATGDEPEGATEGAPGDAAETEALAAGDAVFAEFQARAALIFMGEDEARAALDAALGDERLVNLEARTFFEWRVARMLLEGWRPGHEFLFGPAGQAFHWEDDRRRLAMFGPVGAAMDAAIREKMIFFQQPRGDFERKRRLIQGLRHSQVPEIGTLGREMQPLQLLMRQYPNWMRAITSTENFVRRRQAWEDLSPAEQEAFGVPEPERGTATPDAPQGGGHFSAWWLAAVVAMLLLKFMSAAGGGSGYAPSVAAPAATWRAPSGEPPPPLPPLVPPVPTATLLGDPSPWLQPSTAPAPGLGSAPLPPAPPARSQGAGESDAEHRRRLEREAAQLVRQTRQMLADHQARHKAQPPAPAAVVEAPKPAPAPAPGEPAPLR